MALYQNTEAEALEAAGHLLAHYNRPGHHKGGTFTTKLIELWESADITNQARLAYAFPAMGWAVLIFQMPDGPETLDGLIVEARAKQKADQN